MFTNQNVSPKFDTKLSPKKMMTFYIDRNLAERFRVVADRELGLLLS